MYTEKQTAIIATLLDKWNNRGQYNSIIVSTRQKAALNSVLSNDGRQTWYGISPDGHRYSMSYDINRGWYKMVVQYTEEEIKAIAAAKAQALEARYQSEEYQAEAHEALARINAGTPRVFDKCLCKCAGLI